METNSPSHSFKTGIDVIDDIVSQEPNGQPAVSVFSPTGAGATSLMAQIARASGTMGTTLVFSSMPFSALERELFSGMGVSVCDVVDADELKEIVRQRAPVAVIIDGLFGYPSPEGWKGTRGDYLDALNREMVALAFLQRFALFMSKQTSRCPMPESASRKPVEAGQDDCTNVVILTFDKETREHRLRTVKSRPGQSHGGQSLVFDRTSRTFSAIV
jgi:hypothetical protein